MAIIDVDIFIYGYSFCILSYPSINRCTWHEVTSTKLTNRRIYVPRSKIEFHKNETGHKNMTTRTVCIYEYLFFFISYSVYGAVYMDLCESHTRPLGRFTSLYIHRQWGTSSFFILSAIFSFFVLSLSFDIL